MKKYLVTNKTDDYGNGKQEIVETTLKNAKQYYGYKEVDEQDVPVLIKYLGLVDAEEEKERTSEERFYGHD